MPPTIGWIMFILLIIWIIIALIRSKFSLVCFFKDEKGKESMMRFMSFLSFILLAYAVIMDVNGGDVEFELEIALGVLSFFPKLFQKIVEAKFQ